MATMPEVIINVEAAKIAKLELKPGDTIVLSHALKLSFEIMGRLKSQLESIFPGHRVLVLDKGLDLSVVTPVEGG
jgi:hypothetical protein